MRRCALLMAIIVSMIAAVAVADTPVPPPSSWSLLQNDPNPFCPGTTRIEFAVPQSAGVVLVVLSSDGTTSIRELVHGALVGGLYSVIWDGKDMNGVQVPDGDYPYQMTAVDAESNVLFEATKVATVACAVDVGSSTWSTIKSLYE